MNEELYLLMNEINQEGLNAMEYSFAKSSKTLRFIHFLKALKGTFKTQKAISVIYKEDLNVVAYKKLINRYYKLRQELIKWLYNYFKKVDKISTKEQQTLNFIQYLMNKNQYKEAFDQLQELELKCMELNLFELLPLIMEHTMSCLWSSDFSMERGNNKRITNEYLEKQQKAAVWAYDLQRILYLKNVLQETDSVDDFQNTLNKVRRIVKNYKQFPRFTMLYHFSAFAIGVMNDAILNTASNAILRHLNQLEKLRKQYPKIPLSNLQVNSHKVENYTILVMKAMLFHKKGHFAKSATAVKEKDLLRKKNPNLPFSISAAILKNDFVFLSANKQHSMALIKWEELAQFLEKHEKFDDLELILWDKAMLLFFQFPNGKSEDRLQLIQLLEEHSKSYSKEFIEGRIWLSLVEGNVVTKELLDKGAAIFEEYKIEPQLIFDLSYGIVHKEVNKINRVVEVFKELRKSKKHYQQHLFSKHLVSVGSHYIKLYQSNKKPK